MHIIKILAGAALGAGLLTAVGAAASATEGTKPSADQQRYEVKKMPNGKVKYCTHLPAVTGSRIRTDVCKTAEEWKQYGVEINVP